MSLNEISGYNELVNQYELHREKPWQNWLELVSIFPRPGKQGLVGLFRFKDKPELTLAFKLSQYLNYLPLHEYHVMNGLHSLTGYCPHFLRGIGIITALVEPSCRKEGNPFDIKSKHPVEKELLLMEYLDHANKFYNYIHNNNWNEEIYYSIIKQTLLAVYLAQTYQFTHYDLHSNNILIKKCDRDMVFLYIKQGKAYAVPTNGYYPVIIDYGFSYSQGMEHQPLWASLGHTDIGFISDRYDSIADPKLFLISVAREINDWRKSKHSKTFLNITKNLFYPLSVQWDCGWDEEHHRSACDKVLSTLKKYTVSKLFRDYNYYCLDLLQSLIILPLQPQTTTDLTLTYTVFQKEFLKIEQQVSSPYYTLYILKGIVDLARIVQKDYNHEETRTNAMDYFRKNFYILLDTIGDFCKPKDLHLEKMLCSVLCMAKGIEGELYKAVKIQTEEKELEYTKLPIQQIDEMWKVLEFNLPHNYTFSKNTTIMVMDQDKEDCYTFTLNNENIQELNNTETVDHGSILYKLYTN